MPNKFNPWTQPLQALDVESTLTLVADNPPVQPRQHYNFTTAAFALARANATVGTLPGGRPGVRGAVDIPLVMRIRRRALLEKTSVACEPWESSCCVFVAF